MAGYGRCDRCGMWAMEHLHTHSHCWECNFYPEDEPGFRFWKILEFRRSSIAAQRRAEDDRAYRQYHGLPDYQVPYQEERLLTMPFRGVL